jgi:hypothetical protein
MDDIVDIVAENNLNNNGVFEIIQSRLNREESKKRHEEAFLSVKQKIWSQDWCFRIIKQFNPADDNIMTDPGVIVSSPIKEIQDQGTQLITSSKTVSINSPILCEKDKLFLINFLFDGFIWNTKSALDCFANEARFIYSLGGYSYKRKLHIDDLPNILERNHNGRKLTQLLKTLKENDWYKQLNKYRDTTTHKNVIPKEIEYLIKERINVISEMPKVKTKEGKIFLKKDPEDEGSVLEIELKSFLDNLNNDVKNFINNSYDAIFEDIKDTNSLPLNS